MNLFSVAGLSCGVSCSILALIALIFGKAKIHRILAFFNIAVAIWGFGGFIVGIANNSQEAIFGWKIAHIGGTFLSVLFFHMICTFCMIKRKVLLGFGYLQAVVFTFISWIPNKLITKTRYVYGLFYNDTSFLLSLGILSYLILVIASFWELVKFYKISTNQKNKQTLYIIFGFLFGFVGGTSLFLSEYKIDIVYPLGNFGIMLYGLIVTYAVFKHRIMDIEVVVKRTLIFTAIFAITYAVIAFFALFVQSGFAKCFIGLKVTALPISYASTWPSVILFGLKINVFSIPPFVVSLLTLFLGLFVYLKNKNEAQNRAYLYLCISISLWLFSVSMLFSVSNGDFWAKMVFVGVTFIPITCYHFVSSFLKTGNQKNIIKIAYLIGLFLMGLLFFTNLYILGYNNFFWGRYPKAGILHPIVILLFILLYGGAVWQLYIRVKSKAIDPQQKNLLVYVLVAFFIAAFATMDFIPNYGYCVYPLGYLFIFVMILIFAYVILRHHFLDIEVIIKKTLIFGGLLAVVYAVFAFFALLGQVFFERFVTHNRWVSMVPSVLVVTLMLRPLENFLISVTDKYLFQKKYDYKELLRTFISEVLTVLELDKLIQLTEDRLTDIMKLKSCKFIEIASPATFGGEARNDEGELELPITIKREAVGKLILGKKKSDESYTQEDLDILKPLASTLGIAISNAKLFLELSKTRAEIAQKEKMATIGTLAAGMAHEIRNPMTTIRNFADYLPEKYNDEEFMVKFAKLIPKEIDRIENIARSLLEFSSSEAEKSEECFAITDVVKTALALLEPQYRASEIKASTDCTSACMVRANKSQIQDTIFYITKYVYAEAPKASNISINAEESDSGVSISIKNRDLVVADHIIKDVFEPISGLYREKRGFGFDLFIAKQLIEKSRGTLKINSDKINGAEFLIEFKSTS